MQTARILILDPAPTREDLGSQLSTLGYQCATAHGLHAAMVQAIIRDPALIVADLSLAENCGTECYRQLAQLPRFGKTLFLTIGTGGDLPTDVTTDTLRDRIRERLPIVSPDSQPPESPSNDTPAQATAERLPPPVSPPPLAEVLERLKSDRSNTILSVTSSTGVQGEIMVRKGIPIHAVSGDGRTGVTAMSAISGWRLVHIEPGPPPREETPFTLKSPEVAATEPVLENNSDTAHPAVPPDAPDPSLAALLEKLDRLGIIQKTNS